MQRHRLGELDDLTNKRGSQKVGARRREEKQKELERVRLRTGRQEQMQKGERGKNDWAEIPERSQGCGTMGKTRPGRQACDLGKALAWYKSHKKQKKTGGGGNRNRQNRSIKTEVPGLIEEGRKNR